MNCTFPPPPTFQVIMTQFMGTIAGCVPLSLSQWGLCFAIGAGCVPFGALVKLLVPVPGTVPLARLCPASKLGR